MPGQGGGVAEAFAFLALVSRFTLSNTVFLGKGGVYAFLFPLRCAALRLSTRVGSMCFRGVGGFTLHQVISGLHTVTGG